MAFGIRVAYEPLRSSAFGSITASYTALGTPTTANTRLYALKNDTNEDILVSLDGINDHVFMGANSYMITDLSANKVRDDGMFIAQGTQFWIKHNGSAPTSGSIYLEILSVEGGN